MAESPEVTILLLGDADVGKSTFLSYVYPVVSLLEPILKGMGLTTLFPYQSSTQLKLYIGR